MNLWDTKRVQVCPCPYLLVSISSSEVQSNYNRDKSLTTIVVKKTTRQDLRHMARKDETYDSLIRDLIQLKGVQNKN